jgi:hypothetical protein
VPGKPGGVDQQRCESLYPSVDGDVVNLDTAFGQQLLDVSIGQPVAQIPAYRHHDDLRP